jgi:hypothetical protein
MNERYVVKAEDGTETPFRVMLEALAFVYDGKLTATIEDRQNQWAWQFVDGQPGTVRNMAVS